MADITELKQALAARTQAEEALSESEEKFRRIVETANEGVVLAGIDGKMNFVNKKMADMLGYPIEDVIGRVGLDFMPEDQKEKVLNNRVKLGKKNQVQDEFCFLRKDGSRLWTIGSTTPIFSDKGVHIGNLAMHADITERKLAEEALAADLVATSRLQQIGARFVKAGELADVLGEIVDAAIVITHADMGNIQLFDPQSGCLKIVVSRGFEQPFLDFWNAVAEGQGNCGTAMKNAQRSIVEDVTQSPIFVGTPALEVQLNARMRAVQSTPLFGHSGALIGMLSTHWHYPICRSSAICIFWICWFERR
jgi:PAS domain S-box-containing protein